MQEHNVQSKPQQLRYMQKKEGTDKIRKTGFQTPDWTGYEAARACF